MRRLLALCAVMLLSAATQTLAHRLDEYLQATTFIVDGDHVEAQMRLTPGVQVSDRVLAAIDANGDGVISEALRLHTPLPCRWRPLTSFLCPRGWLSLSFPPVLSSSRSRMSSGRAVPRAGADWAPLSSLGYFMDSDSRADCLRQCAR